MWVHYTYKDEYVIQVPNPKRGRGEGEEDKLQEALPSTPPPALAFLPLRRWISTFMTAIRLPHIAASLEGALKKKINLNKLDLIFFEIPDPLSFYALGERSGRVGGGMGYQQTANDNCSGRKLKKSWTKWICLPLKHSLLHLKSSLLDPCQSHQH